MDTSDPDIFFDSKGICNHYYIAKQELDYFKNIDRKKTLDSQYEINLNYLGVLPYPMETIKGRWVDLKDVIHGEEGINESYKKTLSEAAGFIG